MGRRRHLRHVLTLVIAAGLAACSAPVAPDPGPTSSPTASGTVTAPTTSAPSPRLGPDGLPFVVTEVGRFDEPWAMAFLPGGDQLLLTERPGRLLLVDAASGTSRVVAGAPRPVVAGQGGLGDVALSPTFTTDRVVYLSWIERADGGTRAVVGRGVLDVGTAALSGLTVIWRQAPATSGSGHFSHRLVFSPDGQHLFVSSGDRQKMQPAQDLGDTLGTVVRLTPDGDPAPGNPWADRGGVTAQIWTYGHRNPLGLAFDAAGRLWSTEMGPQGGDELNLIEVGGNYGWPRASNGSHYGGGEIPDHAPGDGFVAPKAWWTPSISPGSLMIHSGDLFPGWTGDAFVGALSGQALIRIDLDGTDATVADQWDMGARIRAVVEAPDGAIWLLEDGAAARLLRLTPP